MSDKRPVPIWKLLKCASPEQYRREQKPIDRKQTTKMMAGYGAYLIGAYIQHLAAAQQMDAENKPSLFEKAKRIFKRKDGEKGK